MNTSKKERFLNIIEQDNNRSTFFISSHQAGRIMNNGSVGVEENIDWNFVNNWLNNNTEDN